MTKHRKSEALFLQECDEILVLIAKHEELTREWIIKNYRKPNGDKLTVTESRLRLKRLMVNGKSHYIRKNRTSYWVIGKGEIVKRDAVTLPPQSRPPEPFTRANYSGLPQAVRIFGGWV